MRLQRPDGESILVHAVPDSFADATVEVEPDRVTVWLDGEAHLFDRVSRSSDAEAHAGEGTLRAPMPGVILAVHVKKGDTVARGQALIVMEAMKMEHTLTASSPGDIAEVHVGRGDRVREGDALLILQPT